MAQFSLEAIDNFSEHLIITQLNLVLEFNMKLKPTLGLDKNLCLVKSFAAWLGGTLIY